MKSNEKLKSCGSAIWFSDKAGSPPNLTAPPRAGDVLSLYGTKLTQISLATVQAIDCRDRSLTSLWRRPTIGILGEGGLQESEPRLSFRCPAEGKKNGRRSRKEIALDRMTDDEILAWLEEDEAKSRPYRVERMGLLLDRFGQGGYMQFFGGVVPLYAFEEMRLAYLNGLYISCVVVSQIIVEHLLAGMLEMMANRSDLEGAGFHTLINEGLAAGLISQDEFDGLDQLRRLRNPYTHTKPIMHQSCFIRRAAESGSHPADLFKQDAEVALTVVSGLLSRYPFYFTDEGVEDE
jgi:hypothetical protein